MLEVQTKLPTWLIREFVVSPPGLPHPPKTAWRTISICIVLTFKRNIKYVNHMSVYIR